MKSLLMSAAVLALLAAPALAQSSSSSSSTETTRTMDTPMPPPPPVQSSTTYDSKSRTHSDNGDVSTDSATKKHVSPDGSTSSSSKTIEQQN